MADREHPDPNSEEHSGSLDSTSDASLAERYKNAQEWGRQQAEELKALRTKLEEQGNQVAEMRGRIEATTPQTPADTGPGLFEFTEDQIEEFNTEPAKMLNYIRDTFYPELAGGVAGIFRNVQSEVSQLKAQLANQAPGRVEWQEKVAALKSSDPLLKTLTDDQAIAVLKSRGDEPDFQYPGSNGSGRGRGSDAKPMSKSEEEAIIASFIPLAGGDRARATKLAKRHIEKIRGGSK